jgi:hypothetical protein
VGRQNLQATKVPSRTLEQSFGFPAQLNSSLQFQRLCVHESMDPIIRRESGAAHACACGS